MARDSMRLGIMNDAGGSIEEIINGVKRAEAEGFASYWLPQIFGLDAMATLSMAARETSRIELGTAVVPTYPRHPATMAQEALTASAASGGRFTLGIGLSHQLVIEGMFGMSYDKPARHMKEYLEVLGPLLRREPVKYEGEHYQVNLGLRVKGAQATGLVVAALGPVMLGHAGRLSDGTITWMTGLRTLRDYIVPTLSKAADQAGRPAPRVVAGLPIALSSEEAATRATIDETFAMYPTLPSYKAMLQREGDASPGSIALVGDETALREQMAAVAAAGVTDLIAALVPAAGSAEETRAFLASF